jgi:hypothetical protein
LAPIRIQFDDSNRLASAACCMQASRILTVREVAVRRLDKAANNHFNRGLNCDWLGEIAVV